MICLPGKSVSNRKLYQSSTPTHVSDLQAGNHSVIQVKVGYSDGFGREIESKLAVEGERRF